ncbi:MAG: hypothetical protein LRY36_00875 [Alphaproteobacteria bacterium]|nr:hypothetical protein [Alphaproteobacteria bacterium]
MSYNSSDLSVLAYANNFTLWHYTTIDANVTDAGYFNKAVDMLRKGDFIIVNVDTDGSPANKIYVVTGNTGSVVTVTVYS